jgi:hypothetical protein
MHSVIIIFSIKASWRNAVRKKMWLLQVAATDCYRWLLLKVTGGCYCLLFEKYSPSNQKKTVKRSV